MWFDVRIRKVRPVLVHEGRRFRCTVDSAGLIPGLLSVLRLKGVLRIMNQLLHRSNLTVQVALCLQKL
jgi:hypothetical protein